MDGLQWRIPLRWMIWGYSYFRKPPHDLIYNLIIRDYVPWAKHGLDFPQVQYRVIYSYLFP